MSQVSFNPYKNQGAILAEDLINTYDTYLEQPEHLREPADLRAFLDEHGIESGDSVNQTMLAEVRTLRTQLRACWTAQSSGEMIALLNPLLRQTGVTVQLQEDEADQVYLQFSPVAEPTLLQRLAFDCGMGIAAVLQQHGTERMRACAAEPCRDVFVDTSKNKTRRFCSDRCANRYNVAAYRDRQKG